MSPLLSELYTAEDQANINSSVVHAMTWAAAQAGVPYGPTNPQGMGLEDGLNPESCVGEDSI